MTPLYEVLLSMPALAPARLSPSAHIDAEVRFAAALERACADTGGVVRTYAASDRLLQAWSGVVAAGNSAEPDTPWKHALALSDAEAWSGHARPAGAVFEVRVALPGDGEAVHAPALRFDVRDDVPF